jgi:hypothetical protein
MKKYLIALAAAFSMTAACADEHLTNAVTGQAADVGTTLIGLAGGTVAEANPLGIALLPLKAGLVYHANGIEDPVGRCEALRAVANTGYAPAIANVLTLAAGLTPAGSIGVAILAFVGLQAATSDRCK